MPAPTVEQVTAYLNSVGDAASWTDETIAEAYAAEKDAQARACTVPADDAVWPAGLAEALKRRVAHNLALRSLPLGVSASITDAAVQTNRVGGLDAEVDRFEQPHRKALGMGVG